MNLKQPGSTFIDELGITRALAILAVIFVHSTSKVEVMLDPDATMFPVYNFFNSFLKIGTTTFIFLSAFVLFYSYRNRDFTWSSLKNFYVKRLKYILIPYAAFSLLYFVVQLQGKGLLGDLNWGHASQFFNLLMDGKAYPHLYFVYVNVQFYLMFPILLLLFKKMPKLAKHALWIGFVLQWAYIFLNMYYIKYPYKGSISFSYMSHYFLGIFAAFYFDAFMNFLRSRWKYVIWTLWVISCSIQGTLWTLQRMGEAQFHLRLLDLTWSVQTWLSAIVLLQFSYWLYAKLRPRTLNLLLHLGACSFGVYLIHPLVLLFYREWTDTSNALIYQLTLPGAFITALLVSWLFVYLLQRFSISWVLLGNIQLPQKVEKSHALKSGHLDKGM